MKRENVVGRANVEDTPELEAYYRSLEGEALGALWNVANEIEPWCPQPKSVPTLWKWKKVEPFVRRAPELVSAGASNLHTAVMDDLQKAQAEHAAEGRFRFVRVTVRVDDEKALEVLSELVPRFEEVEDENADQLVITAIMHPHD